MDRERVLNTPIEAVTFRRVKVAAIQGDMRISDVVNSALKEWLDRNEKKLAKALTVTSDGTPTGA